MHYLTQSCLMALLLSPGFFLHCATVETKNSVTPSEPVQVIFVASYDNAYLQCFRVNQQSGELTDIPQCSKDFSQDLDEASVTLYDLEFQDNHLYLISAFGGHTLEYDLNPDTLVLSNPRIFYHGIDTFAGFLFGDMAYFPCTSMNRIYQFSIGKKDGSLIPMSPSYIHSGKTYTPGFIVQNPFEHSLFYVSGFNSSTIGLFQQDKEGSLHEKTDPTFMWGTDRIRYLAIYQDFLYATAQNNNAIYQFRIDRTDGHLIPLNPISVSSHGYYPVRTFIHGNQVYIPNGKSNTVSHFTIQQDGTLVYDNTTPFEIGKTPFQLIADNQVHRLYANSENSPWISSVKINEDGTLDNKVTRFKTHAPDPRYFLAATIQPTH